MYQFSICHTEYCLCLLISLKVDMSNAWAKLIWPLWNKTGWAGFRRVCGGHGGIVNSFARPLVQNAGWADQDRSKGLVTSAQFTRFGFFSLYFSGTICMRLSYWSLLWSTLISDMSDCLHVIMALKKIRHPARTRLHSSLHNTQTHGAKLNKQTSELSVCVVPVTAFSLVQIS